MSDTTTAKKAPRQPRQSRRRGQRLEEQQRAAAQATFLASFAQTANFTAACRDAGVDRSTAYRWQEHDEAFALRYRQAEGEANDVIRGAIFRRAIEGIDKPLHYQGRLVKDEYGEPATVKEYSDTLLIFLAKARMPEFREKQQVEQSGEITHKFVIHYVADWRASHSTVSVVDSDTHASGTDA